VSEINANKPYRLSSGELIDNLREQTEMNRGRKKKKAKIINSTTDLTARDKFLALSDIGI